jgi:diacylglycerol O-acyltransferase
MKRTRMKPMDAIWLMMDSPDTPMHVGVLAIFQKPHNVPEDYLSDWAQQMRKATDFVAPWNYRLAEGIVPSVIPSLVENADVDLDYHFRHSALPEPGGERELGIMISRLHSNALDHTRPLWEFHLIEGLERDRFACYVKVHHALIDNVNAIPMVLSALSASARTRHMKPLWTIPLYSGEAGDATDSRYVPSGPLESMVSMGKAAAGFLRNTIKRKPEGGFLVLSDTPRSTLNRRINAERRFATQQFEQQRIEKLAEATDSHLNDILAYLCSSSLRRFFKEYNALPETSLIGAMPVSLQERSDRLPGNAIAGLRVPLATDIGDPLARLQAIKTAMKAVRDDRTSLPDEAVTPYVLMRAAPIYASQMPVIGSFVPPLFNLGVSNTPGPERPQYLNGARLESIYPLGQLMQFSALSIDCVSYAGTLNIGYIGARDTLPHLQRLAVYMGKAVSELEQLIAKTERVL